MERNRQTPELVALALLPIAPEGRWRHLVASPPDLVRIFAVVILPLAAIPPLMLYLAGTHPPDLLRGRFAGYPWATAAAAFYAAEIGTFVAMGWLIRSLAGIAKLGIDVPRAYLIAAAAAVPTWMSAIGLALPSVLDTVAVVLAGLALSCRALYVGVVAAGRPREPLVAAYLVHAVMGTALVGWAFLLVVATWSSPAISP